MRSFNWERTYDADLINSYIADDPAFFRVKDPHDFPNVVFLHCEGVGIFPGIIRGDEFHAHACVIPHSRGRAAVHAVKEGIRWVFENLPVDRITTKADRTKRHLLMFNATCFNRTHADEKYVYYEVRK